MRDAERQQWVAEYPPSTVVAVDELRWLNPSEMAAWRTFIETQSDLVRALDQDLDEAGMTLGDYQVLVVLSEAPDERMRMRDLADRLQLTPSGLTRRIDGLVRSGAIERVPFPDDRRSTLAALTDSGRESLVAAAPIHLASVRQRMVDLLDEHELDVVANVFQKIRVALDS